MYPHEELFFALFHSNVVLHCADLSIQGHQQVTILFLIKTNYDIPPLPAHTNEHTPLMFCFEIEKGRKKPFWALFGTIFPVENICGSFICKISESTIQRKMEPDVQVHAHPAQCKLGQG